MSVTRSWGITLIELMIVVVVIGILAAIAIPSYQNATLKSHRHQGQDCIMQASRRMEVFYTRGQPPTYTTDLTALGYSAASALPCEGDKYRITAAVVPAADSATCNGNITRCYRITATPRDGQEPDGTLRLTFDSSQTDPNARYRKERLVGSAYQHWD